MKELTFDEVKEVNGGIAPAVAVVGYFVAGTSFGVGLASAIHWAMK
ncbi:hypothetical protein ACOMICROBIO_LMKGKHOH_01991 [Vibrio sp. B1FIG11]|nr:class IIb bacteriocin, lactobin A/cerein 7B family [Vibrio sp. B1FIG11]CAD7805474.1 hypothetical protein ACOMICROBIO_LMKGKHOH_01991 [Vibrio sp. B1FIG11]CAE6899494.1 hypothetical protein ACOMICROBIO_LMKGKHOH_01991 [Vibrio sp. B1FIG11]